MTKKKVFFMLFGIWLVDLITTIICLTKFKDLLIEGNPRANFMFSFGVLGWVAWGVLVFAILYGFVELAFLFKRIIEKRGIKSWAKYAVILPTITFCLVEFYVIINNIVNIIFAIRFYN